MTSEALIYISELVNVSTVWRQDRNDFDFSKLGTGTNEELESLRSPIVLVGL